MTEIVLPNDTNVLGNLRGGTILHWMDIACAISGGKHSNAIVVTASVDNVSWENPIRFMFSLVVFLLSVDDHGSPVIFRSASVRPKHLFDQNFDHDYYCKLPLAKERDAHSLGRRFSSRHA